ncbi:MAG: acetate kinase [Clostridia bacterium]|nr:acetate kinase [Clostridia bacterium]
MKILVLNCGSSSLKYQLINMDNDEVIAKGNYERIGMDGSFLTHKFGDEKKVYEHQAPNHEEAIAFTMEKFVEPGIAVISSLDEIDGIGHRIVHGGERFTSSVVITEDVVEGIRDAIKFAPLHNPAHIQGIEACFKALPGKTNVAVFDTAFHQTMPKEHYIYPIPYEYYEKYGIRKYGAHGTSHKYVTERIAEILGRDDLKVVSCHIGQGASISAVQNGKCIDTSMGLTPLAGIPMGSRSGDLDPSVVTYIMEKEGISPKEMETILNKKSGLLGMSGVSADNRDIETAIKEGNENAKLAIEHYAYKIAGYIAKFAAAMNGADVIVFTAGVGERGVNERKMICKYLGFMGVELDEELNNIRAEEVEISKPDSKTKVWIVPTNEELMIARETLNLI